MIDKILWFWYVFFYISFWIGKVSYKKLESMKIKTKDKQEYKIIDLALLFDFAIMVILGIIIIIRSFLHY